MTSKKHRATPNAVEWLAAAALAGLIGVGVVTMLRADEGPARTLATVDQAVVQALGAPTGVLAVVNPVNCALTADDAAALSAVAAIPGVRVTVLLLALPAHDSVIRNVRRDFGFSPAVAVAPASTVDPRRLPELLRMPFVALIVRGQLRHAAWGESLKSIRTWLPRLSGLSLDSLQPTSALPPP